MEDYYDVRMLTSAFEIDPSGGDGPSRRRLPVAARQYLRMSLMDSATSWRLILGSGDSGMPSLNPLSGSILGLGLLGTELRQKLEGLLTSI